LQPDRATQEVCLDPMATVKQESDALTVKSGAAPAKD
jgi:hypothetical protein